MLREPRFAVTIQSFLISHGSLDLLLRSLHVVFLDDLFFLQNDPSLIPDWPCM